MAEFDILYQSQNNYEEVVNEAIFEFCVLPCTDHFQTVIEHSSSNSLQEPVFQYKNTFGFEVLRIRTNKEFNEFSFTVKARVDRKNQDFPDFKFLTVEEQLAIIYSTEFLVDHHLYLAKTHFTTLSAKNQSGIMKYDGKQYVFEFLDELNSYIHGFEYKKYATDVKTTADQAFDLKAGVCQDFTHLFIAIARLNKIPARYVSGYLNQGSQYIGDSQMHAWVEAFIPGAGWIGFDPTNDQLANINYIKVSHGVDYSDCSPLKGIMKTTPPNKTTYKVKVVEQ